MLFIFITFCFSNQYDWLQYPNNKDYIQYFFIIIGLDAICVISFAKLREKNNAIRFALIRLLNIFINITLNLFFIVYCPYAIDNGLSTSEFLKSIYSENYALDIFLANLIASIITFLMLLPEMIKSIWIFDKQLWKKMMIYIFPLLIVG